MFTVVQVEAALVSLGTRYRQLPEYKPEADRGCFISRYRICGQLIARLLPKEGSVSRKLVFAVSIALSLSAAAVAAKHDSKHIDPFMSGDANESRIAREVRHQLVMLPYYG